MSVFKIFNLFLMGSLIYIIFFIYIVILELLKTQRRKFFNLLVDLSKLHDYFNKYTFVKVFIFILIGFFCSYFIYQYYLNIDDKIFFHKVLGNGFFLAPLILLIINNQKYIIENFIKTFKIETEGSIYTFNLSLFTFNQKDELDPNSKRIRNNIVELVKNIDIINKKDELNKKWKTFKNIVDSAVEARLNFERLNNQSLLIVAILLLTGYISLLVHQIFFSIFFLIISFLILINRVLILGIRSLLKYYCIDRESMIILEQIKHESKQVDEKIDNIKINLNTF